MRISDWSSDVCSSDLVLKMGTITMALMGDPNASISTPQPVHFRPMFGAFGRAATHSAVTFLSGAAHTGGVAEKLGLSTPPLAVLHTRGGTGKASMVDN